MLGLSGFARHERAFAAGVRMDIAFEAGIGDIFAEDKIPELACQSIA